MNQPSVSLLGQRYVPLAGYFDSSKTEQSMLSKFVSELAGCRIYVDHSSPKGAMIWRLRSECKQDLRTARIQRQKAERDHAEPPSPSGQSGQ